MSKEFTVRDEQAIQHLMDLLAVQGLSGKERDVAECIKRKLIAAGCSPDWITEDDAHTRIPGEFEMGNLIVRIPGNTPGPCLMLSGHMDTVPLTRGAVPKRVGDRIVPEGDTALGADNRTACAAIVSLAERLLVSDTPRPPLTLLFTVGEETGLWGAKEVDVHLLGEPIMGFNIDSGEPERVVIGAIGAHRWHVNITGKAAHAGVHPDQGVSAALIASKAVSTIHERGYFGAVRMHGKQGTSNVGIMKGGEATNQVTDTFYVKGESRSHDPAFLEEITKNIEVSFNEAAANVMNQQGTAGSVEFSCQKDYHAFRLADEAPVVERTRDALVSLGMKFIPEVTDGGLDANFLNLHGIPTVTLGAGQHNPHTPEEYADLNEFVTCCNVLETIVARAV